MIAAVKNAHLQMCPCKRTQDDLDCAGPESWEQAPLDLAPDRGLSPPMDLFCKTVAKIECR